MSTKSVILNGLNMSDRVINTYIGDLDDADLLVRPVEGMNHIAWQLGHLILSERGMVEGVRPGSSPELPAGFEEGHGRDRHSVDDPGKFLPRSRYQELWKAQRDATRAAVEAMTEEEFAAPAPEPMRRMCQTAADVLNLAGIHAMMHAGQFVPVRRKLGKPVSI